MLFGLSAAFGGRYRMAVGQPSQRPRSPSAEGGRYKVVDSRFIDGTGVGFPEWSIGYLVFGNIVKPVISRFWRRMADYKVSNGQRPTPANAREAKLPKVSNPSLLGLLCEPLRRSLVDHVHFIG